MAESNVSGISKNLSDSIEKESNQQPHKELLMLQGKKVAISVSGNEDIGILGFSEDHIKDLAIEIARYLMVNGATMLYGGDLRNQGFTEIFRDLSYQYKELGDQSFRFINYFPFPASREVTLDVKTDFRVKQVLPRIIARPKHLENIDLQKEYEPKFDLNDRYIISECLSDMRRRMSDESDARIVLGGKLKGYSGYYPGIVEETFLSIKAEKPVYLIGGFGGAAKSIADTMVGQKPDSLTDDFQIDTSFLEQFYSFAQEKGSKKVGFGYLSKFFKKQGVEGLASRNGLTLDENKVLFETINIHEVVFLIMKGLRNIS